MAGYGILGSSLKKNLNMEHFFKPWHARWNDNYSYCVIEVNFLKSTIKFFHGAILENCSLLR